MPIAMILSLIELATKLIATGTQAYSAIKSTMSETDHAKIHEALLAAEHASAALRPQVDAALLDAANH
jgi:non-homologous end joining protein Ku